MKLDDFTRSAVPTGDGITVAAFDSGAADADATKPTLFLVNGLGGNLATWRHLAEHFSERGHRVVTWDYRGLFASKFDVEQQAKHGRGEVALGMAAHRDDAIRVMDRFAIERCVSFGWSMGVQLNWDLLRHHSERIVGAVQICGAAGKVIETTALGKLGAKIAFPAMELFRKASPIAAPLMAKALSSPWSIKIAAALGAVAPTIDHSVARAIAKDYVALDFDVYNRILAGLAEADARDFLPTVTQPVLLVAGDRDVLTPAALSVQMHELVPGSELVVMKGASHYLPIEFPSQLNSTVADFLARRVEARSAAS